MYWAPASFGDGEANLAVEHAVGSEALTPCRVFQFSAKHYFQVMFREPTACFRQYWDTACRFGIAIQTEHAANIENLEQRVVSLLSSYVDAFSKKTILGHVITLPLTQQTVALQVGSNRRTIVRGAASKNSQAKSCHEWVKTHEALAWRVVADCRCLE